MRIQKYIIRFLFLFSVVVLLALSSCTKPFSKVDIKTYQENQICLPKVSGFMNNSNVNEQLKLAFLFYANTFQDIVDSSNGELAICYEITEPKNNTKFNAIYDVTMYVSSTVNGERFSVLTVEINNNNKVSVKKCYDVSWLTATSSMPATELIESVFVLKHLGIDFEYSDLKDSINEKFLLSEMIDLYEILTKKEIDTSSISINRENANDELYKKALLLDLSYYTNYSKHEYSIVSDYSLLSMVSSLIKDINRDVYGKQDGIVTSEDMISVITTMSNATAVESFYSDISNVDTASILNDMDHQTAYLTREQTAEILCKIFESSSQYKEFLSYVDNPNNLIEITDSDNLWVRKAITYSLMNYYGNSVVFAPEEYVSYSEAIDIAEKYVFSRLNCWNRIENKKLTNADAVICVASVYDFFKDEKPLSENVISYEVINDRSYDWFLSQSNTGEFSSINCMPSIAAMATRWYYPDSDVTVEDMRNTSDSTNGWSGVLLRKGLTEYNVPYATEKVSLKNVIQAIDEHKIVLVQYSDRPFNTSGHCYIIYGYRKYVGNESESYVFIINDSDSLDNRSEIFGRQRGNGDEINSKFAMWSIQRFVKNMTIVG